MKLFADIRQQYGLGNEATKHGDETEQINKPLRMIKGNAESAFLYPRIAPDKNVASRNQVLEETIVPNDDLTNQSAAGEFRDPSFFSKKKLKQMEAFKSVLDEDIPWEEYGVELPPPR